jgi:oligopeptide/dipeptide ABC transporter ATP-binding protein
LAEAITGCPYASRCQVAQDICSQQNPSLTRSEDGRLIACHLYPLGIKLPELWL